VGNKILHIVSFDVPYPANYGGVIDIFYKIKALNALGVQVHLHTFEYGRGKRDELNKICKSVTYYKRKKDKIFFFNNLPFIVVSRKSTELLKNISADEHPVLFEGLHCCYYLDHPSISKKIRLVRSHNIEHDYYSGLAGSEKNFFKHWYFSNEAKKLKQFESIFSKANHVLTISPKDTSELSGRYKNVQYIPAFHANDKVYTQSGKGSYALYHGNLSVGENNTAAIYLVNKIFNELPDIQLIIAGNDPSNELIELVKGKRNVELKKNISTDEINRLIQNAQINILPTFQPTGLKLKLLSALYNGRHCIVNWPMVENTGLESLCHVTDNEKQMQEKVKELMPVYFEQKDVQAREQLLDSLFSNNESAKKLIELI